MPESRFKQKSLTKFHALCCCWGCSEQWRGPLIYSGHYKANKSCYGSPPNIQVGLNTKAMPACFKKTCNEKLLVVIRHNWDCLITKGIPPFHTREVFIFQSFCFNQDCALKFCDCSQNSLKFSNGNTWGFLVRSNFNLVREEFCFLRPRSALFQ